MRRKKAGIPRFFVTFSILVATATAVAFTATAAFATVFMTVIVAMTTAATVVVVIVVVIVRAVNVTMSQFFFGRFANRHNFNVISGSDQPACGYHQPLRDRLQPQ